MPITIGRAGAAWGIGLHPQQLGPRKKEGDGRSPAGVFRIGDTEGFLFSLREALGVQTLATQEEIVLLRAGN